MTRSWAELPKGRVVRLNGVNADIVALSIDPLPDDAPAIVTYFADGVRTSAEMVASVLRELEKAAIGLFPVWLPGAEDIGTPGSTAGGAAVSAVRALALRLASVTGHFGPFLADLAERSLRGADRPTVRSTRRSAGFAPEVRAAGLARVLAAGFGRSHASILVRVQAGLSPSPRRSWSRGASGSPIGASSEYGSPAPR